MSNKLQTTNSRDRAVLDPAKLFEFFLDHSKDRKITRKKTILEGGVEVKKVVEAMVPVGNGKFEKQMVERTFIEGGSPVLKEVQLIVPSKNALRNKGVTEEEFAVLATMIKPYEKGRIAGIIKADQFEAVQCFMACMAHTAALDEDLTPKSWKAAEEVQTASIATVVKYKGEAKAVATVQAIVTLFTDNFGTKNQMDARMIKRIASEIVRNYYSLTIADLKFIFGAVSRMAPEGLKKRRFSFSVDPQQIMELIEDSVADKRADVETRQINEHVGNFSVEARYRPERKGEVKEVQLSQDEIQLRNERFDQAKEIARQQAEPFLDLTDEEIEDLPY